jgi:aminopeptidase N
MRKLLLFFLLFPAGHSSAQKNEDAYSSIDVTHYNYQLELNDSNNIIKGLAEIDLICRKSGNRLTIDLSNKNSAGKGMEIAYVELNGRKTFFTHLNNLLELEPEPAYAIKKDSVYKLRISYTGIPADGLIISVNKYGHRTFFADNWPNRAHNWIPCNDHPSDKASVEFRVSAPQHYQVISNGMLMERSNTDRGYAFTHWQENKMIPTKVMVIGLADFAVEYAGILDCIPVSSWVYPEDKVKGFYDYSQALDILPFFIQKVAPYPYDKLANVQSKTIFGGMENAGCIFYYENSVNGSRKEEGLLTHEIAHQWFGNSATEIHWSHLWLSEGFATYLTDLYFEYKYGKDSLQSLLEDQRSKVISYYKQQPTRPVVDSLENNYMNLLNANSYQKGGWILHMLRRKMGDAFFWQSVSTYYKTYAGKNAGTNDFKNICEKISGISLDNFFDQWLYHPGHPQLAVQWKNASSNSVEINIRQLQKTPFKFPLDISFSDGKATIIKNITVSESDGNFHLKLPFKVGNLTLDPGTDLLAEWKINTVK